MAGIGLVSPGVKVREVDLTVGRIDSISDQTGAIVGPFERGPVLQPLLVENEQDMIDLFGKMVEDIQTTGFSFYYTLSILFNNFIVNTIFGIIGGLIGTKIINSKLDQRNI